MTHHRTTRSPKAVLSKLFGVLISSAIALGCSLGALPDLPSTSGGEGLQGPGEDGGLVAGEGQGAGGAGPCDTSHALDVESGGAGGAGGQSAHDHSTPASCSP